MNEKALEDDVVKYLNQVFIYTKEKKDRWTILRSAPFEGDCEDYSLTILWHFSDRSWKKFWMNQLTGKAKLLICKVYGVSHVVLEYDGKCIDNIQKKWTTKSQLVSDGYRFNKFVWPVVNTALNMTFKRKWF